MKGILVIVCLISLIRSEYEKEFAAFQTEFNKVYASKKEQEKRLRVFAANLRFIEEHNANPQKTYNMGITPFTDLTDEEIAQTMLMPPRPAEAVEEVMKQPTVSAFEEIDWRKKGAVTSIKDQNPCGSCYSFGAVGSCEGTCFIETGELIDLSAQQCVDCSSAYGNQGCDGGFEQNCMRYYAAVGGIMSDKDYPYIRREQQCKFNKAKVTFVTGSAVIVRGEANIQGVIPKHPSSICMYCTRYFNNYKGGLYNDTTCSTRTTNHAMTVVGMTKVQGVEAYIVKNSWGTGWGDRGYLYIPMNENHCAIGTLTTYPSTCKRA